MMVPDSAYSDKELLEFLGRQESQDIGWGNEYADDLVERIETGHILKGDKLPWEKTHNLIRLKSGEVTVWAGMNGHMKSFVTGFIMQWLAQTTKVGIASFEMPIVKTMERMVYQAAGCIPSKAWARQWAEWNHERIAYYNKLETVGSARVLGAIFYMAKELGCKHIVIDSLAKCGLPARDAVAEKDFIDTLGSAAKALNIHIHLVCHVRKPAQGGQTYIPNKFDVKGAGELTDLVDNVVIVWMDKRRAEVQRKVDAGMTVSAEDTELLQYSTHRLIWEKQREGEFEGTIGLWFDGPTRQFLSSDSEKPRGINI